MVAWSCGSNNLGLIFATCDIITQVWNEAGAEVALCGGVVGIQPGFSPNTGTFSIHDKEVLFDLLHMHSKRPQHLVSIAGNELDDPPL